MRFSQLACAAEPSTEPEHEPRSSEPRSVNVDFLAPSVVNRQKNFLEMLNPMYQSSLSTPPRASCAIVVPMLFEKLNWKT
jgi:hypothetical protein